MRPSAIKVLYVEDNIYDFELVQLALARSNVNCEVSWQQSGERIFSSLQEAAYDLILLDFNLPQATGLEVFRALIEASIDIPVIFLTGGGDESIAVEAIKLGAYDYLVKDSQGEYLQLLTVLVEKTMKQYQERKARLAAEEALIASELRFRTLASHAPVGIFETNAQGRHTFVNEHWVEMTGIPVEDALTMVCMDTAALEDRPQLEDRWAELIDGRETHVCEYRIRDANGDFVWVASRINALRNENGIFIGALGTLVDLTEIRQSQEKMRMYADELEARNRELDVYVHTIAHDLRNPLTTVSLLTDQMVKIDDKVRQLELFNKVSRTTEKMNRMIEQLLYLAKLRHEVADESAALDLYGLARDVVVEYEMVAAEKGIKLEIEPELPALLGHDAWVRQILGNLIGNAIKYMPKSQTDPLVEIWGCKNGVVGRIEVRDNGRGIAPGDQEVLFDMFTRVPNGQEVGFGLGLSIVKQLAQKMDGQVGVESTPGEGATFWLELPLALEK